MTLRKFIVISSSLLVVIHSFYCSIYETIYGNGNESEISLSTRLELSRELCSVRLAMLSRVKFLGNFKFVSEKRLEADERRRLACVMKSVSVLKVLMPHREVMRVIL